ncbi:alpha/beta hydrolase [Streptomyces sp. NPDC059083]|uniref:alpha/beta fold hydrolase n=1 Tax=unclassified Streptomyces TaxID=2593676 RepID=UPI0036942881
MDEVSRGRVVSQDGTEIAYERYGAGRAVVLVDGPDGAGRVLAGLLARRFRVVTYERRGAAAVEREIEDLAAVLGAAGPGAALHGAGTGAVLALAGAAAGLPVGAVSVYEPEPLADGLVRTVRARVLVVDGGASPAAVRRTARDLSAALPRARHRTLTGQTGEVAPHVLAPVLAEFLEEPPEGPVQAVSV